MKKSKTLNILILLLISTIIFAQEDEWSNKLLFNRVFENGQKISEFEFGSNEDNIFGKNSHFINGEKIFELVKYDADKDQMLEYMKGRIENLEKKITFQRDSTTFIYSMQFLWTVKNLKNNTREHAIVKERQITDFITKQIITTVHIRYKNSGKELYCWSEEDFSDPKGNQDIILPQVLKVKRVSLSMHDLTGLDNPHDYISYALWTKKCFYRYAKKGLKDKIEFTELIDSTKIKYTTTMIYKDTNDKNRMYMNNYRDDNYNVYVSTLDLTPFPIHYDEPVLPKGSLIVWEKANLSHEFLNMIIKLEYIGNNGFSEKEIKEMKDKKRIIELLLSEYKNSILSN